MRTIVLLLFATFAASAQIQAVRNVQPAFPPGAEDVIFGDVVPVIVSIDRQGKVTDAITLGPHVPCSGREEKTAREITKAVLAAARASVYAPHVENGKPADASFLINYKLPTKTPAIRVDPKTLRRSNFRPYPEYPQAARDRNIEGKAQISVLIDESGQVISAAERSGPAELRPAGLKAAGGSRFDNVSVKTLAMMEFTWSMDRR